MDLETQIADLEIDVIDLKRMNYKEALKLQEKLREERKKDKILNTVLFVEHDHVYTIGTDFVDQNSVIRDNLPSSDQLVEVNRGGKITYHGPGQLVGYFIFKVPLDKVGNFQNYIEDLTIDTLRSFDIRAFSRKGEQDKYGKNIRGAWCRVNGVNRKVAAQGLEFKAAGKNERKESLVVTMHGFAFNVNTDLDYFKPIKPCGFEYDVMTSMREILGKDIDIEAVKQIIKGKLINWRNY